MAEQDQSQSLMTFPCDFPLKVIGKNEEGFTALVIAIIRRHIRSFDEAGINSITSGGWKYLSISITLVAESREQLDALYSDLGRHEQIIVVL